MRTTKFLGLALAAVLAFAAMSAASASAATELKLTKGAYPAGFTVSSTEVSNLTASTNVECSTLLGHGTLNSATDALVLLLFHKCTVLDKLVPCTTAGEPSGLIHSLLLMLFNRRNGVPLVLVEKDKTAPLATFECAGAPVVVEGTVNGVVTNRGFGTKSAGMLVNFEVNKTTKEQLNTEGEEPSTPMKLTASTNGGAFEPALEEVSKALTLFEGTDEAEFVE